MERHRRPNRRPLPLPRALTPPRILAEGPDWLAAEKPAGLIVHPSKPEHTASLWHALRDLLAFEIATGGQVSLVNRLDRETSGIVLVAKSAAAARRLCARFGRRETRKIYLAIVSGHPPQDRFEIAAPILRQGRVAPSLIHLKQCVHPDGADALTRFQTIHRFLAPASEHPLPFSLVRAEPVTGRLHQIRVHLAHAGFPVLGDKIYGPCETAYLDFIAHGWTPGLERSLLFPRHALHAASLELPSEGISVSSPLPPDMENWVSSALPPDAKLGR